MAKLNSIFTFTGKIDNAVGMKGDMGETYARKLIRNVLNPQTEGQVAQRLKVSLAGQISALTPKELLSGMPGSNNRQRRSAFTSNIIRKADILQEAGNPMRALLGDDNLVLSEGLVVPMPALSHVFNAQTNIDTVTVGADWPDADTIQGVVLVAYATQGDVYVACDYKTVLRSAEAQTVTFNFGSNRMDGAAVYAIPLVPNASVGSARYERGVERLAENPGFAVSTFGGEGSAFTYEHSVLVTETPGA